MLTPCILNSHPHKITSCCPILLQHTGVAPMGACGTGRTGVLVGDAAQDIVVREGCRWAGGTPRLVPGCGDPCASPSRAGGPRQPQITSPTVMPRGQDGATFWPSRVVTGSGFPWVPGWTPRVWDRGCPTPHPQGDRTLRLCLSGCTALGTDSRWRRDVGCWVLLHCAPRAARERGGAPEGPGGGGGGWGRGPVAARTPARLRAAVLPPRRYK